MVFIVVAASAMLFLTSCDTADTVSASGGTDLLTASSTSVSVLVGSGKSVTISGGKMPYSVKSNSDTTKVGATISGSVLTLSGRAAGSATIVVKDSAGTATVSLSVTVATMIASPNTVSVVKGSNTSVTISGGTSPYSIQTAPDAAVATASISGSTVTINGVAAGSTSVTVKDNSASAKTVIIPITVTATGGSGGGGGFTTAGSVSFSSNVSNFSANGIYDSVATTGSGAGGFSSNSSGQYSLVIFGYKYNSSTSVDLTMLIFFDSAPIGTGTYVYPPTTSKFVSILFMPGVNPNSETSSAYQLTTSATASISAITASNATGTFSGNGTFMSNGVVDPSKTISVTGGTFNVPVIAGDGPGKTDSRIEALVKDVIRKL